MRTVYLHGFASSPASVKAAFFRRKLAALGVTVEVPDLNQPSFRELTLTRIVATVSSLVRSGERVAIIGSSLGGYAASLFACRHPDRVAALVLMAPAFNMATLLREQYGDEAIARWRGEGTTLVEHPAFGSPQPLDYAFQEDAEEWARVCEPKVRCPTLVLHGRRDQTVPIEASERFVAANASATLVPLDSEHGLTDVLDELWEHARPFLSEWRPNAA